MASDTGSPSTTTGAGRSCSGLAAARFGRLRTPFACKSFANASSFASSDVCSNFSMTARRSRRRSSTESCSICLRISSSEAIGEALGHSLSFESCLYFRNARSLAPSANSPLKRPFPLRDPLASPLLEAFRQCRVRGLVVIDRAAAVGAGVVDLLEDILQSSVSALMPPRRGAGRGR